jgi:hypothetical protein
MRSATASVAIALGAIGLFTGFVIAGDLNPPAGPVTPTGVTTQELADLIAGGDPCQCDPYLTSAISTTVNSTILSSTGTQYIKRVTISKSDPAAEVSLQLREPGGPVIGFYLIRSNEGSIVADVDLTVNGLVIQSLSVSSGTLLLTTSYKNVP